MGKPYYVTSCERPDGWGWQVRTGAYPSAVVEHVADDAVAAHVWAEGRGYTLINPAATPDQTNHAAAIRLTPTEQLGRLICHSPLGVALMDRYIWGGEGLAPLHSLAAGLQNHLDHNLPDLTPEKRALGQSRIDALRSTLAAIEAQPEAEREADRRMVQRNPVYQLAGLLSSLANATPNP